MPVIERKSGMMIVRRTEGEKRRAEIKKRLQNSLSEKDREITSLKNDMKNLKAVNLSMHDRLKDNQNLLLSLLNAQPDEIKLKLPQDVLLRVQKVN